MFRTDMKIVLTNERGKDLELLLCWLSLKMEKGCSPLVSIPPFGLPGVGVKKAQATFGGSRAAGFPRLRLAVTTSCLSGFH